MSELIRRESLTRWSAPPPTARRAATQTGRFDHDLHDVGFNTSKSRASMQQANADRPDRRRRRSHAFRRAQIQQRAFCAAAGRGD